MLRLNENHERLERRARLAALTSWPERNHRREDRNDLRPVASIHPIGQSQIDGANQLTPAPHERHNHHQFASHSLASHRAHLATPNAPDWQR